MTAADAKTRAVSSVHDELLVIQLDLIDSSRPTPAIGSFPGASGRELPTAVYLPAAAEPAPLIVLAHGFNGHPRKFTELAGHWAGAGYVVAVPRFPVTNDEFADTGESFFGARLSDLDQQALDVSFVIDEITAGSRHLTGDLGGRVDPDHIGLYGLSLGSLTVWATVLSGEDRIGALMQSDGGHPGDPADLSGVSFPVFLAHSDVDATFPAPVLLAQFELLPEPKFLLVLHGAAHAAVGENTPTPADDAYRAATTVFWDRYLGGKLDEPFPGSIVIDGVTSFTERA